MKTLIELNEELSKKQKELDVDKDGDIEGDDLKDLRDKDEDGNKKKTVKESDDKKNPFKKDDDSDDDEDEEKEDESDEDSDKDDEKPDKKDDKTPVQFKKKLTEERAIEILRHYLPIIKSLNEAYTEQDWFTVLKSQGWKNEVDDFWSKTFDGIQFKGEMNPTGKAKVVIKPKNNKMVATFGDTVIAQIDPRYNDPSKNAKKFEEDILKVLKSKNKGK